jgi:hypothetical protein
VINKGNIIINIAIEQQAANTWYIGIFEALVNSMTKYVFPYAILCPKVKILAIIDNCPRIGINRFIALEPFGKAPVTITITNNAPANPPLANIGKILLDTKAGKAILNHVIITTAKEINVAIT